MRNIAALFVIGVASLAGCAENTNRDPQTAASTTTERSATSTSEVTPGTATIAQDGRATGTTSAQAPRTDTSRTDTSRTDTTARTDTTRTDTPRTDTTPTDTGSAAGGTMGAGATAQTPGPADATRPGATNTDLNERDRGGATLTPGDQGGSAADRNVTATVRRALVSDGSLSFTAKNVKIITVDGKVTLRGPVKSAQERTVIEQKAKTTPGVKAVDNQLEIKN